MTNQPAPELPETTRRRRSSIRAGVLIGCAAIIGVCVATAAVAAADAPSGNKIRYEVTGSTVAEYLTYEIDFDQRHETNVPLPWSTQFTAPAEAVFVLSAQSAGPGSVTCKILINGQVVSQVTSSGAPARAACSH